MRFPALSVRPHQDYISDIYASRTDQRPQGTLITKFTLSGKRRLGTRVLPSGIYLICGLKMKNLRYCSLVR